MPPTPPEFNDWTLTFLTPLPVWARVLVVVLLLSAVVAAHLGLRGEPRRWRRAVLTSLRAVGVLAAIFFLLEPAIQLLQVRRVKNRVAVLLDTSASMQLAASKKGRTRLDEAKALLSAAAPELQRLSDRFVFEYSTFDRTVYPADLARLAGGATADGTRTDLLGALRSAASGTGPAGGRKLAGVVLLTDGGDTEDLRGGLTSEARDELEKLGAPVHAFVAGSTDDLEDVAVTRVLTDDFAFVRNAVEVEAVLHARGLSAQDVPVVLRREGRVVSTRTAHLEPGEETRVHFRFTPDTTGKFIYTVSVPVLSGEAVTTNNQRSFVLKVIRDRVRVLQVAGRPSWDERFLRGLLKKDPNVDLISFFILRTPQNTQRVPQNDLSLIPFPTNELFTTELKTFDLVIFQNFDYAPYNMSQYLDNVRQYVEDGGAFVMIGGDKSFTGGRYQGTYIEDILPVELLPSGAQTVSRERFAPRLTEDGRRHPSSQLADDHGATDRVLGQLPELDGLNLVRAVKPGAQVLLEHPFLKTGNTNAPVVAVEEVGRGRSMAVMTDSTWFWSFPAAGGGGDRRVYDRFWTNAMRWLIRDPDLTNVRIRPTKDEYEPGERPVLEVSVRDKEYGPAAGAAVDVTVYADDGHTVGTHHLTTGDDGVATLELDPPGTGAFKVVAEAKEPGDDGAHLGREEGAFLVRSTTAELVDPAPRPALLEDIADATGGSVHTLPERSLPDLSFVDPEVVEIGRKKNVDLWDRWAWLALFAAAFAAEWSLRRRWGRL